MIKDAIAQVVNGRDLSQQEMAAVMNEIMSGEATDAQIGALLTGLRLKGETVDEICGAAQVMRDKASRVSVPRGELPLVDTCGTGGDASGTFNVSTTAAFVVAAAGVPVAKHGNRSITSHCGSADVLEALGVDLNMSPERIGRCIQEVGIGFMFAPKMHPAMKHAIGPRREMGIRTIFNLLGPLTNPAGATVQLMGVYDAGLIETLATVLGRLGAQRAMVVCGEGNMDEITVTGPTVVAEYAAGAVQRYTITPEDLGMARATLADISGAGSAEEAADQVRALLSGAETGARHDMVVLNAGAALMAAGKTVDLAGGVELARQTIAAGAATAKLAALVGYGKGSVV